jgi:hypothetical protein
VLLFSNLTFLRGRLFRQGGKALENLKNAPNEDFYAIVGSLRIRNYQRYQRTISAICDSFARNHVAT